MKNNPAPEPEISGYFVHPALIAWSENLIFTLALPVAGYWLRPLDPLFMHSKFPWLVLAPLVMGLRYGFFHGFSSALTTTALIIAASHFHYPQNVLSPTEVIIGTLLIGMVSGEFRDRWNRHLSALQSRCQSYKVRQDEFVRSYHLLKASHTILENQFAGNLTSLRLLLIKVRQQMSSLMLKTSEPLGEIGDTLLHLFSAHCQVRMAALYPIIKSSKLTFSPAASLGIPPLLSATDPLIAEALREGRTTYLKSDYHPSGDGGVLAVVPLSDVRKKIWGLIVIYDMPLAAFQKNNFTLMALLGGHFGDLLMRWANFGGKDSNNKDLFQLNMKRCLADLRFGHIPSTIVAIAFKSQQAGEEIIKNTLNQSRCLDLNWMRKNCQGYPALFKLMPLTDEVSAQAFIYRLETELKNKSGLSLSKFDAIIYIRQLTKKDTAEEILIQLESQCQIVTEETSDAASSDILRRYGA